MRNVILTLLLVVTFASCSDKMPEARFENAIDTLSYCLGTLQAPEHASIASYLEQIESDSNAMGELLHGFSDGVKLGAEADAKNSNSPQAIAYNYGLDIGQQLLDRILARTEKHLMLADTMHLNVNNFIAGFSDVVNGRIAIKIGDKTATREQLSDLAGILTTRLRDERSEELYGEQKRAGLNYIASRSKEPGVKLLADGIYYKELQAGTGATPTMQSKVRVRYEGRFIDGKVFDTTANHGTREYDEFPVSGVIKGWQQALTHMSVGSKWEVYIPYDQAYGAAGNPPDMPPFSTLVFTMELVSILP